MTVSDSLREQFLEVVPSLRAFAVSLSGRQDRADDLVQETLVKAWAKFDTFEEGTNLRAWMFTILRNQFYSEMRKKGREVQDVDGVFAARLATHPEQDGHLDLADFREALADLPDDQREALILIGASGFSYEEASEICGVAVGTVKSRVSRARTRLHEVLDVESENDFGPDRTSEAVYANLEVSGT
jgi:RNA polymerase sigma-70 factor (ECF subfamily)